MDCHLCGERHGSGADELLERLEGTQRAQRCALKRLTNQFWLGQTFVRTLANCQALYCGAPIITASDCQRCNSQSAAGDEICVRQVHIQFPATIKVMKHQICMMCSPSPAAFQRRGAQKICIWKLLSCWQWQNHPHRAHRGYLLRRQDDVSALWSLAPSPKNRWPSHYWLLPGCHRSSPWCQRFCGYCSAVGIEKISALGNPWCCWSAGWRHGEVIGECCQDGGFPYLCLQILSNMFSENIVLHDSSEFFAIWFRRLLLVEVLVQAFRQLYTFFRSVEMESRYQWTLY